MLHPETQNVKQDPHVGLGWSSRAPGDAAEFPREQKRLFNILLSTDKERVVSKNSIDLRTARKPKLLDGEWIGRVVLDDGTAKEFYYSTQLNV